MTRVLCALLLLIAASRPALADDAKPLTTILLVARSELPDPNFKDSVLLVMNNVGPAPAGIIINRPTTIRVSRLFPELEPLAQLDDKLYFGGPVDLSMVSFLFRAESAPENATEVLDGVYISTNRIAPQPAGPRQAHGGHANLHRLPGWSPGQLEAEIARGDWTLAPAEAGTIFDRKPEHPWPGSQGPDSAQRI